MQDQDLIAYLFKGDRSQCDLILKTGDAANRGCREGWELRVLAPSGDDWSLLVDDEPLLLSPERLWHWSPGFYAGLVQAELQHNGRHVATYRLEVSPHPDKLALSLYEQMLDELLDIDPLLVLGTEPATTQLGALGSQRDAWVAFRRLRIYSPAFLKALRQVSQRPIRSVRTSRRTAPIRSARRVDVQTVRTAAMTGSIGLLLGNLDSLASPVGYGEPTYDLPWYEQHFDGPANRCITAMLLGVHRRAAELLEQLEEDVRTEEDSETRTGLAARWPIRRGFLENLISQLKMLMRTEPFCSVTQPEITAAGLNAIAHPVYARAYRCGWQAIRPGLEGLDSSESVWLCPTWELYERWCFGMVVKQLRVLTGKAGSIKGDPADATWEARSPTGTKVRAFSQRRFTSRQTADFHSISRERQPDIVVTAEFEGQQRYLVLDAKYSQSRQAVLTAMASAHIYNDSLRWNQQRPGHALLMVPAPGGAPWLEEAVFISKEGVGVLVLSPENGQQHLLPRLEQLIDF